MEKSIHILHLEDDAADAELINTLIALAKLPCDITWVKSASEYKDALQTNQFDIILADYQLPDYDGLSAMYYVKETYPDIPFVFVSGMLGEDAAIEALTKGATDYVLKHKLNRLVPSIERELSNAEIRIQRKQAQDDLKVSEEKYRLLSETMEDVIVGYNINGDITYLNNYGQKLVGIYNNTYNGRKLNEFIPEYYYEILNKNLVDYIRGQHGSMLMEIEIIGEKGRRIPLEVRTSPILSDGKVTSFISMGRDITERVKARSELIAAKEKAEESDRLKSAFLANMSHEIRTPMNGILGFAELLKEPKLTGEEKLEYVKIIETSGLRMLNIINNIVDISKIESGQMEVVFSEANINDILDEALNFFQPEGHRKGIELVLNRKLTDEKAIVTTDVIKLHAIITNLIKNAIKYTHKGTIEFGCVSKSKTGNNEPDELEFFVSDTGIGIPKERQQAIFERFIQAEIEDRMAYQGAGLGLAISKAYIEMLGGKIWVESECGKGSIFYFTIPCSKERTLTKVLQNLEAKSVNILKERKMKILIVDDDETSVRIIKELISKFSYTTLVAENGIEALELCRQHDDIDLVLMDIRMPVMNGYKTTQEIRRFNSNIIILAQTAYALLGDKQKAIDAGCNDYISKPISRGQLAEMIANYCYGK